MCMGGCVCTCLCVCLFLVFFVYVYIFCVLFICGRCFEQVCKIHFFYHFIYLPFNHKTIVE